MLQILDPTLELDFTHIEKLDDPVARNLNG